MNSLAATLFLRLLAVGNAEYGGSSSSVLKSPDNGTVGLVELRHEALECYVAELLDQSCKIASNMEIPDVTSEMGTVQSLEDELLQALDKAEFDEADAKDRAMALASARFDALGSEDYESMRLKYILSNREQDGEFDAGLFFDIASAILIYPGGAISLKLKNGKIIEKECSV